MLFVLAQPVAVCLARVTATCSLTPSARVLRTYTLCDGKGIRQRAIAVSVVELRLIVVVVVYTWSATVMSAALQNVTVIKPRGVGLQQKLMNSSKVDGQRCAVVRGVVRLSEL